MLIPCLDRSVKTRGMVSGGAVSAVLHMDASKTATLHSDLRERSSRRPTGWQHLLPQLYGQR